MQIKIKKGLNIPLSGEPEQTIGTGNSVSTVALLGPDTIGLKPRMEVREGEHVRLGQALFTDKQNPGVQFTSPGSGTVTAINRGERRVLQSVVIQLDGEDAEEFESFPIDQLAGLSGQQVRQNLLASGLWTAFRTRPYSKIPEPDATTHAIFVTAIDTNPLAADPAVIIARDAEAFGHGMQLLSALTDGSVYLCTAVDSGISMPAGDRFEHAEFGGPHPAGLAGTHIHFLDPVSEQKTVWHIGYQEVIAIGKLFVSGRISVERVIALGGPLVTKPRLIVTRLGANTSELVRDEFEGRTVRVISGSVLAGHRAAGWAAYLGRYDQQISILQEGSPREFLSFMRLGTQKFSSGRAFAGHLTHRGSFPLTSTQNGSPRAMVSIGSFETVMPLDILATPLLKALLVGDTDSARELGCLELAEEDLALCTFVCNGKYDYGPHLRSNLLEIEVNG
jgi:Na+-transporting NADH:ubiquinone oxidoreductase subunit A